MHSLACFLSFSVLFMHGGQYCFLVTPCPYCISRYIDCIVVYYFQARGHGGYDSDFSDEENGEKSVQKTKR